jgi:pimeloyl-ACP methyl ester carboxylesterase
MANPTLLLLPGLICDARLWQHQVADLKHTANCHVADFSSADTVKGMAASALRRAPPGQIAVAGMSMGGYVALEILRQAPERVIGLALIDTNARPDSEQATADRQRMMKMAETDYERVVKALWPKLVHPSNIGNASVSGPFNAMAATAGKDVYTRQQRAIIGRTDSRPMLGGIRCPTLVLCGREDQLSPVALHEEMANAIPGARMVVAEKCGHLSPLEQPRQVTLNLVHWISGLRG